MWGAGCTGFYPGRFKKFAAEVQKQVHNKCSMCHTGNINDEGDSKMSDHMSTSAHPNFELHAHKYAAKLAADSILAEPSTSVDLSDVGIVEALKGCVRPVRLDEAHMVREAFVSRYARERVRV